MARQRPRRSRAAPTRSRSRATAGWSLGQARRCWWPPARRSLDDRRAPPVDEVLRAGTAQDGDGLLRAHQRRRLRIDDEENRSEEHTSELQSRGHLVCRLLLEKKKN